MVLSLGPCNSAFKCSFPHLLGNAFLGYFLFGGLSFCISFFIWWILFLLPQNLIFASCASVVWTGLFGFQSSCLFTVIAGVMYACEVFHVLKFDYLKTVKSPKIVAWINLHHPSTEGNLLLSINCHESISTYKDCIKNLQINGGCGLYFVIF